MDEQKSAGSEASGAKVIVIFPSALTKNIHLNSGDITSASVRPVQCQSSLNNAAVDTHTQKKNTQEKYAENAVQNARLPS